jgi:hypothetical protein
MNNEYYILPDNIKEILTRYFDGFTSLEEEKLLRKYFTEHHIPLTLKADQAILSFHRSDEVNLLPAAEIWRKIKQSEVRQNRIKKLIRVTTSVAASLIIISACTWYYYSSSNHNNLAKDTYTNPEDAYRIVQKYLGFTSSKLSIAYNEMKPIEKLAIPGYLMAPLTDINNDLQPLNLFNRLNSATKKLEHLSVITNLLELDKI